MEELIKYLESKNAKITYAKEKLTKEELELIPNQMKRFYRDISSVEITYAPFWELEIYSHEQAIKASKKFQEENKNIEDSFKWFVLGKGMNEIFLLCTDYDEGEELWFTSWDRGSGSEIDAPVYEKLVAMLKDIEEEYEDIIKEALALEREEEI